jgi:hypothetical protein
MLFLTRCFGVTGSDRERNLNAEPALHAEIVEKVLLMQAKAAAQDHRPLLRGTHAKGVTVRARFEVLDVNAGRDRALGARLAQGIFRKPGIYPATVRFANSDSRVKSDFKPDVRSLSFSVDLTWDNATVPGANSGRQDFSLQSAPILPINDAPAFLAITKLLTASNPAAGLWALPFKDKLRVLRTLALLQFQLHQKIKPYQQLRYWSDVPFRHGPLDVVKYSATPCSDNPARILQRGNPNALAGELIRHIEEDHAMSAFDFGVQFLEAGRMTYWGKRRTANFWIENASVKWNETEAPFHTLARLTLLAKSHLPADAVEATYIDVTANSTPDSTPLGSMNRARWHGEVASREARLRVSDIEKKDPRSAACAD